MSSLPNFPSFPIHNEENSAGSRWSKWLSKFENMLHGLAVEDPKRIQKALLLHYIGDEGFDVYHSFTATQKGDENSYDTVKASFTTYFTPRKNIVYETYKFRQTVQQKEESIDSFYTHLRALAATCDFHDQDREILSQVLHGCVSSRIRRKALKDNLNLKQVLEEARAFELSDSRAAEMKGHTQFNFIKWYP